MSDTTEVSSVGGSTNRASGPRWRFSIVVWFATLTVDIWFIVTTLAERDTPIYGCGGEGANWLGWLLVPAGTVYGLRRVYLHPVSGWLAVVAGLLVVAFGLFVWSDLSRIRLCLD